MCALRRACRPAALRLRACSSGPSARVSSAACGRHGTQRSSRDSCGTVKNHRPRPRSDGSRVGWAIWWPTCPDAPRRALLRSLDAGAGARQQGVAAAQSNEVRCCVRDATFARVGRWCSGACVRTAHLTRKVPTPRRKRPPLLPALRHPTRPHPNPRRDWVRVALQIITRGSFHTPPRAAAPAPSAALRQKRRVPQRLPAPRGPRVSNRGVRARGRRSRRFEGAGRGGWGWKRTGQDLPPGCGGSLDLLLLSRRDGRVAREALLLRSDRARDRRLRLRLEALPEAPEVAVQPRQAVSRARRRCRAHAARAVRVRHRPGERATERWRRLRESIALRSPERSGQLRPLAVRPVRPRRRARLWRTPVSSPRRAGSAAPPRRDVSV